MVLGVFVVAIYLALVFQFKNAIKPFIVFAAIPTVWSERCSPYGSWEPPSPSSTPASCACAPF
jgi:hypothetical protein